MKTRERPILFNAEMVRAILEGRKTQTRRVMKVQPPTPKHKIWTLAATTDSDKRRHVDKQHWAIRDGLDLVEVDERYFRCPYGQPGDRLWVREHWGYLGCSSKMCGSKDQVNEKHALYLHPLHPYLGNFERESRRPSGHVDRRDRFFGFPPGRHKTVVNKTLFLFV